jgi:threonine dehydrogenase-like Zn-dependent dehydrogenase
VLAQDTVGAALGTGPTLRMGQTHAHTYLPRLLKPIEDGDIDPSFLITHRLNLEEAPDGYETFKDKKDGCVKVVLQP